MKMQMVTAAAIVALAVGACPTVAGDDAQSISAELLQLERDWSQAFVKNDAAAIGRYLADDWVVIGEEGDITGRAAFLEEIRSGRLVFEKMDLDDMKVRSYGNAAVVIGRATSAGKYQGQAFSGQSRWTDVFVRQDGGWRCVSAQLTPIGKK